MSEVRTRMDKLRDEVVDVKMQVKLLHPKEEEELN